MPMIAEATGTGMIAEFLQPLERFGCRRLDGRVLPSGDVQVDHVLIAPPGVFVIGAKAWDGRLEVVDGVLRRDGVAQIDQVAALVSQASAISSLLDSWTGESISIPVHAVVAFIGPARIDGWAALAGAHAVDGPSLAEFITKFPAAVGIEHVNWAYQALDDHLPIRMPTAEPAPIAPAIPLSLVPPIENSPVDATMVDATLAETPLVPSPFEAPVPSPFEAPVAEAPPVEAPVAEAPPEPAAPEPAVLQMSPPVMVVPMVPVEVEPLPQPTAPPVAVAPPMADSPRQAPNEPIVFLSRSTEGGEDRLYVRDEEGYPGGYLDLRTGLGAELTSIASVVMAHLLPAYLPDGGATVDYLPPPAQDAIRHFLATQGKPADDEVPSVVACAQGHIEGRPRLYASLLQSGGRRTDLGWIDLVDRRTSTDVPGVDPILRYCGDAFLAVVSH